MGIRLRRRDPVMPGAALRPGAKRSHLTGLARTLRTLWWPRIALAGVVLTVIGATLLKGAAQAGIALLGVTVFLFAASASSRRPTSASRFDRLFGDLARSDRSASGCPSTAPARCWVTCWLVRVAAGAASCTLCSGIWSASWAAVRYEATVCIAAINEWLLPHL